MQFGICWAIFGFAHTILAALALPPIIKIGAIFTEEERNGSVEIAFKYAVHKINKDRSLLPKTNLVYDIQYVKKDDSFHACKKACSQVRMGVHAVFGPSDPLLASHIHSICDALDIPHLEVRLDPEADSREFSINLYPAQKLLNLAFQDIMSFLNWTRFAIIYEEDFGLIKLRELVKSSQSSKIEVYLRQADVTSYRRVLKEIKSKEINNFIVDTKPENLQDFLKGILQLQMNDYKYHYLFTTFDLETFDLEDFKYNFVNMTAFRIIDTKDLTVQEILRDMARFQPHHLRPSSLNSSFVKTEAALIYDSVFVFAVGLQTLDQSHTLRIQNASCDREEPWDGGLSLINYINSVEMKGLSGPIELKESQRVQFTLDLLKLKHHSVKKVGEWRPSTGLNITDRAAFFDTGTTNVTLVVTTILEPPYVMMHHEQNYTGNGRFYGFCMDVLELVSKEVGFEYLLELVPDKKYGAQDPETGNWNGMVAQLILHEQPYVMLKTNAEKTGNGRYEGFCIDLLAKIAVIVGFDYRIELVPDGKYGVIDLETGEWNGIVRQLMEKKADLAVGSMTINYARESVIDFTKPFMNLGISILFKRPEYKASTFFSFMNPLGFDIWMFVVGSFFMICFTIYALGKLSPIERLNVKPWRKSEFLRNGSVLSNAIFFVTGTLLRQPSGICLQATSTRIVGGIWWFFTLIMISSYTANLAAFLTVERMITPIENAEDLASQTEITYGTLESGSTMTFFRDSMIETYKKMWRFMENKKPSVFVPTYEEGIKRVLEGNYAFLMESTMLDYIVQRNCNLTQIGGLLDSKGYGIATPMGSPWRDKISLAILDLQEKGEIQMLYDKWWKNTGETCSRDDKGKESKANSLGVDNIGGVFVVLLCGLAFAVIVAICEFCYNSRKGNGYSKRNMALLPQQSLCTEMASELCFAMRCRASRQRPALRRQCSKCLAKIANHDATGVGDGAGGGVATNPILPPPSAPRSSAKVPAPATSLVLLPHQFNFSPILGNENRQCFEDLKERLQKPETIKVNSSTNTVEPPPKTKRETLVN
ncbi:glutamate receptor ionotropic, kainate 3-like isoform X2 [Agrilus planipennis]|uniref:Glutamate receptor ionotropic, kainate 3-like isoform X2 n=1 Tax=Agrilus planipennis TaxID=224129 RepID=A0A1W4WJS4_AGRPL|nr:glutamate receptor ionotropic, kainate 3-like isoform X2 [Agrilus planipennis]